MIRTLKVAACAVMVVAAMTCFGCASGSGSSASSSAAPAASSAAASSASASAASSAASATQSAAASASASAATSAAALEDDVYTVDVDTDSSMFHVNEAKNGKGELTVADGKMTVHMTLVSKKITNLYAGTADEAKADSAGVIQPTTDKVTYSDGMEEEVYGFDVPVPALDEPFAVAILGEKGSWYDHEVTISNPVKE